jgi:hypothetical protein
MLSAKLLTALRAHWRCYHRRSSSWLFPSNYRKDRPIDTKTVWYAWLLPIYALPFGQSVSQRFVGSRTLIIRFYDPLLVYQHRCWNAANAIEICDLPLGFKE